MYPAMPTVDPAGVPVSGIPIDGVVASQWSSRLCHCSDDCNLCCLTCWCPCITFGRVAEIVDRGATSCGTSCALFTLLCFTGFPWVYSCIYRGKMRAQFGLPDRPCCDCCVHLCCQPCALTQEHRELQALGLDPTLGWALASARRATAGGAPAMYPPSPHGGMGR